MEQDREAGTVPDRESELTVLLDRLEEILEQPRDRQDRELAELERSYPGRAATIRRLVTSARSDSDDDEPHPAAFGAFRVVREIGRGGMGRVYLAERDQPRQLVALKVMQPGFDDAEARRRFVREQRALASLADDRIAKLLEAPRVAHGPPYFVMEYVDGVSITDYCATHGIDVRQRVRLFRAVCEAVHHAHQKGVMHRDLKPTNILVAGPPAAPTPKVIDFGLARFTVDGEPSLSGPGRMLGTPDYMSPEQFRDAGDVDIRTDVYALGVVLYELVAGRPPYHSDRPRPACWADLEAQVLRGQPPRPSSHRPRPARRALRELDWVVAKAIDVDPDRRYRSADDLARELRRFDACEPVEAGPPSWTYRAGKLMQRRWRPMLAALVVLVALLAVALSTYLQQRAAGAQASFDAARLAAQRGRWSEALQHYGRATDFGYRDPVAIAVGRIEALRGLRQKRAATAALDTLLARGDLGRWRLRAELLDADLKVDRMRDPRDKLDQVRALLDEATAAAARDEPVVFSAGDRCYAEALLAPDAGAAIAAARRGLTLEPSHRMLAELLGSLLVCSGRLDEAEAHAAAQRTSYPDDPAALQYDALVRAVRGGDPKTLAPALGQLSPAQRAWVELGADVGELLGTMRRADRRSGGTTTVILALAGFLHQHADLIESPDFGGVEGRDGFYFSLPPQAAEGLRRMLWALARLVVAPADQDALDDLARASEVMGEGTALQFRANLELWNDRPQQAELDFARAGRLPSLSSSREAILLGELLAQTALLKDAKGSARRGLRDRAHRTIDALLASADTTLAELDCVMAACWQARFPHLALETALQYRRRDPRSVQGKLHHAAAMARFGAYVTVKGLAEEVLAERPDDPVAKHLLGVATAALHK